MTASAGPTVDTDILLRVRNVRAGYGQTTVLRDLDLEVFRGRVTALVGPNGAGKTTLLRVIAGLARQTSGTIEVGRQDVSRLRPSKRVRAGICLIPEGRGIFPSLTVADNLALQAPREGGRETIEMVLERFPALKRRRSAPAGSLSGGQQQQLALCRAYLAGPDLLMVDEVSMGLAPMIVDEIYASLKEMAPRGMGVLLVEQYVPKALEIADEVALMRRGSIVFRKAACEVDAASLGEEYMA